jgi:hypothetical protein
MMAPDDRSVQRQRLRDDGVDQVQGDDVRPDHLAVARRSHVPADLEILKGHRGRIHVENDRAVRVVHRVLDRRGAPAVLRRPSDAVDHGVEAHVDRAGCEGARRLVDVELLHHRASSIGGGGEDDEYGENERLEPRCQNSTYEHGFDLLVQP